MWCHPSVRKPRHSPCFRTKCPPISSHSHVHTVSWLAVADRSCVCSPPWLYSSASHYLLIVWVPCPSPLRLPVRCVFLVSPCSSIVFLWASQCMTVACFRAVALFAWFKCLIYWTLPCQPCIFGSSIPFVGMHWKHRTQVLYQGHMRYHRDFQQRTLRPYNMMKIWIFGAVWRHVTLFFLFLYVWRRSHLFTTIVLDLAATLFTPETKKCFVDSNTSPTPPSLLLLFFSLGRCPFRQYMPSKPAKYGIKSWVACDAKSSYAWKMQVHTGKPSGGRPEQRQGLRVVLDVTEGLHGRNVTCDNYFTSYERARQLLKRKITVVGKVRKNKPQLPTGLLVIKGREVFSTKFAFTPTATLVSSMPKKCSWAQGTPRPTSATTRTRNRST